MKSRQWMFLTLSLAAAILAAVTFPAEAAFNPDRWPKYSTINQGNISRGYALIELTPAIYHLASPDLRDLRVVRLESGRTVELPYDIVSYRQPVLQRFPAALINRGVNKTKSTATVFLGENAGLHNHLEIQTADRDFIKQVTIEGSENKTGWVKLESSDTIAEVTASGEGFQRTGVTYSETDYPYLRITLTGAGKPVSIDGVDILFKGEETNIERTIQLKVVSRGNIKKDKTEEIVLATGFNNLKLHSLVFSVDSVNFSREAAVFSSQDMKQWFFAGEGKLELLSLPQSKQPNLSLPVNSTGHRYYKVIIRNGDDPPLNITGVKAGYSPDYLLFPGEKEGSYRLYLSNRSVKAPEYDLVKLSPEIMAANPPVWTVSYPMENPSFKPEPVKVPESEKHKWLLPVILAILVAVLGIFIIKSLPHVTKDQ